jgi:uncharacterized protein (TIGR01777 family)
MKIVVTGATGFVGQIVVEKLLAQGHEVHVLTRNIAKAAIILGSRCKYFQWNDSSSLPPLEALEGTDGIINLMGETISEKWTDQHKKKIYHSRIDSTRRLVEAVEKLQKRPGVLVSTSAVGIYGNRESEELTETSSLANDFLANVCKDWENEANKAKNHGLRVVIVRVGVVIGKGGGALQKMLPIFKLGGGGPVGSGKQVMSWIHVEDVADIFVEASIDPSFSGVYNGTGPNPATNKDFSKTLGQVLHRPAFAPAPAFMMKLVFGEMSQILLEGQKVLPKRLKEKNFRFRYPTLEMALKESTR